MRGPPPLTRRRPTTSENAGMNSEDREEMLARFWARVKWNLASGCWEWQGVKNANGYGSFNFNKKRTYAHRFSYQDQVGPIPAGLDLCHSCDNRICVCPSHLRPGTREENVADAVSRGRHARGEASGSNKLTNAQV